MRALQCAAYKSKHSGQQFIADNDVFSC